MKFEDAVRGTPSIRDSYAKGLSALREVHRGRISVQNTRSLTGSIDLDTALERRFPNDPRWDYGVGYKGTAQSEKVVWIEIHPARSSDHLQEIENKAQWLNQWLKGEGKLLKGFEQQRIWISSGKTAAYISSSRQMRRLSELGVKQEGGHFTIS